MTINSSYTNDFDNYQLIKSKVAESIVDIRYGSEVDEEKLEEEYYESKLEEEYYYDTMANQQASESSKEEVSNTFIDHDRNNTLNRIMLETDGFKTIDNTQNLQSLIELKDEKNELLLNSITDRIITKKEDERVELRFENRLDETEHLYNSKKTPSPYNISNSLEGQTHMLLILSQQSSNKRQIH